MLTLEDIGAVVDNNDFSQNLSHLQEFLSNNNIKNCDGITDLFFQHELGKNIGFAPLIDPKNHHLDPFSNNVRKIVEYQSDMLYTAKEIKKQYSAKYESNDILLKIAMVRMSANTETETLKNMTSEQLYKSLEEHMFCVLDSSFDIGFMANSINEASRHLFPDGDKAITYGKTALINVDILNHAVKFMEKISKEADEIINSAKAPKEDVILQSHTGNEQQKENSIGISEPDAVEIKAEEKFSEKEVSNQPEVQEIKETDVPKIESAQETKINNDEPTKAYKDFGEILKDQTLTEDEQMWYLNNLIEEEKQQLAERTVKEKEEPKTILEMSKGEKRDYMQSLRGIGNKSNNTVTDKNPKTLAKNAETNHSTPNVNISALKNLRCPR